VDRRHLRLLDHAKGRYVLIAARGFSIIELMIGLTVLGLLVSLGIPAFTGTMQNLQVRGTAEAVVSGLQTARNEAVRRNTPMRFQLVSTLDNGCVVSETGPHWIVSRNDVTSVCATAEVTALLDPNVVADPQILQKRLGENGTATIAASTGGVPFGAVTFNSLGRVVAGSADTFDIRNSQNGCEHDVTGPLRCMRILVRAGGQVKMCDPKVTATTDSRFCQ
jgi:type IV fimbrial biogenesis protein FimT